jgi:hypothetical protein
LLFLMALKQLLDFFFVLQQFRFLLLLMAT